MSEPIVLLEDPSPNGNGVAVVEQDDRVASFYFMTDISGDEKVRSHMLGSEPPTSTWRRLMRSACEKVCHP
jgi:hypothetical protein